jgi:glycosyltransferase involved in cell wall biosynthesis
MRAESSMASFLFIDSEHVWRGGQDQLLSLLRGLSGRGHELHLICHPQTLLEERARALGLSVFPLAIRSEIGPFAFWRLAALLRKIRPDILAFNTPRPILVANLASRLAPVRARIIFRRVSFPLRRNPFTKLKYSWGIDWIVAISESIRQQLELSGLPGRRIKIIYEGLDLSLYPRRPKTGTPPGAKPVTVGTVAHLSAEKGLSSLIEAAARIPDVRSRMRFIVVGEGEIRRDLERETHARGMEECFQFVGFQSQVAQFLSAFDIFVLPSLSEGLSSAILAAMASSLPVVATHVGGIPELVRHGENGILVSPGDSGALARAIDRLADNPEERLRMGEMGRLLVEKHFTLERKILETEELFLSLLRQPASVSRAAHA